MRFLLVFCLSLFCFSFSAHAFRGYNAGTSLGLFSEMNCSTGLSCTRVGGKYTIANSGVGVLRSRVLASAVTITAAQCGSTFYNAGAVEMDLPEASAVIGCRLTFVTLNASNFDIDPDAADIILVTTNAAGDRARNATLGNTIVLEAVSASEWVVVGIQGTWTDAN